jgi:hypothetical protein
MFTIIAGKHHLCMGKTVNRKHLSPKWCPSIADDFTLEKVAAELINGPRLRVVAVPAGGQSGSALALNL